ncbi:hypothetical protein MG295_00238 [Bacillus phage vB_BcgM]|nr:hypothetical protein MG295_00238 [Bacillus phage vB_BcgM]
MYLVFAYDYYYPAGGLNDVALVTEEFKEVMDYIYRNYEPYHDYLHGGLGKPDSSYDTTNDGNTYENIHILNTRYNRVYEVSFNKKTKNIEIKSKDDVVARGKYK